MKSLKGSSKSSDVGLQSKDPFEMERRRLFSFYTPPYLYVYPHLFVRYKEMGVHIQATRERQSQYAER